MKKQLLLAFVFPLGLLAQPIITSTGIAPVVKDAYVYQNIAYQSPGASGANQTWNFAAATIQSIDTSTALSPSGTTYATDFPTSTVAVDVKGNFVFVKTSNATEQWVGIVGTVGSTQALITYSNPEDLMHFPFTYGNSYTDPYTATVVAGPTTFVRTGIDSVTADGYGTLKLPSGTYTNVLRVHVVQNYQDSTNVSSLPYIITYHNDEYLWYTNGTHNHLASSSTMTLNYPVITAQPPVVTQTSTCFKGNLTGIAPINAVIASSQVFPNPTNTVLNLKLNLTTAKTVSIKVYDGMGKLVLAPKVASFTMGENTLQIPVTSLPVGIYTAEILAEGDYQPISHRFIVN